MWDIHWRKTLVWGQVRDVALSRLLLKAALALAKPMYWPLEATVCFSA